MQSDRLKCLAFVWVCLAVPAHADECGPLVQLASVDIAPGGPSGTFYAPVTINGLQKYMVVDTGGAFSIVTRRIVDEMQLPTHEVAVRQFDVEGRSSNTAASVANFALGTAHGSNVEFMVGSNPNLFAADDRVAGMLGPNILHHYDIDLDFGAGKLNLISPDHCDGKVVYWQPSALAIVPMHVTPGWHVVVPVTLDGHSYHALLDTGAYDTVLNMRNAEEDFGLDRDSMTRVVHRPGRPNRVRYVHRFGTLDFGGVSVSNPDILILPDMIRNQLPDTELGGPGDTRGLPDMLIGMDVLRHLHIYIAYKEEKLYISSIDQPVRPDDAASASTPPFDTTPK